MNKQLIGITGGIGSGKSRVCRFWAKHFSLPVIDLDAICKSLLNVGEPGWQAIQDCFGDRFFTEDAEIDRPLLRQTLFADNELRRQVDNLLHPLARKIMGQRVRQLKSQVVLVEIPLLFEAGWSGDVDAVVVVFAGTEVRCRRIVERDKVNSAQAMQAIRSQMSLADKVMSADHVIDNSGDWLDTCLQIIHAGQQLSGK